MIWVYFICLHDVTSCYHTIRHGLCTGVSVNSYSTQRKLSLIPIELLTEWICGKNCCAVIGILFSSQEMPSTEEEGAGMDLSSPLSVSLHQRHFLTDWWNAMHPQKQMESFVPSKPVFRQTAVTKPLPQRFTAHPKLMSTLWQIWWSLFLSYYLSSN